MKKFCLSHVKKENRIHFNGKLTTLQKKKLISWLFLLPSLIGVIVFFVAPFMVVIYYSMINNPIQKEFVGVAN